MRSLPEPKRKEGKEGSSQSCILPSVSPSAPTRRAQMDQLSLGSERERDGSAHSRPPHLSRRPLSSQKRWGSRNTSRRRRRKGNVYSCRCFLFVSSYCATCIVLYAAPRTKLSIRIFLFFRSRERERARRIYRNNKEVNRRTRGFNPANGLVISQLDTDRDVTVAQTTD